MTAAHADAQTAATHREGRHLPKAEPDSGASLQALLAEVAMLANQLRKTTARVHGENESPAAGWGILRILDRQGPQTVPGIARLRALSRQSIQFQVNRLVARGYVALATNPAHKRSGLVQLTDRGRGLLAAAIEREDSSLDALLPDVAPARLVPATRLLRRLRHLLGGNSLPPEERAEPRVARKRKQAITGTARRSRGAPAPPDQPLAPATPTEPPEEEFPVNLL